MKTRRGLIGGLLSLALVLPGCSSVSKEASFGSVQKTVTHRTGHVVQWRGHSAEDESVDAAIRVLLERELSADDAVQLALLNNLGLQATYQELGIAQADLVEAGLLANPTLSVQRRFKGKALEIDVAQNFLDLLVLPMRKKISEAAFDATKQRVTGQVLDLVAEVRAAYYTLQGAEQMVEMRRSVVEATDASSETAKRLRAAGNVTELELRNELNLSSRARLDLAEAEAEAVQDRERLNVLLGLWGPSVNWSLANRLPELPEDEGPVSGLESRAVTQRSDLAAGRQEILARARSLGITEAFRYVPIVTVTGHYEREPEGNATAGPSVEIALPIFNQGQPTLARGRALLVQSQQRFAALAIEIRSQVRAMHSRMSAARKRADYYRRVVLPLQEQIAEQTQLEYNGMLVGVFQLLLAKQAQIDAGREYIEALRDYWVTRSELERAVGGSLSEPPGDHVAASQATQLVPSASGAAPAEGRSPSDIHQGH